MTTRQIAYKYIFMYLPYFYRGGEMVSSFLRGRKADQLTQLLRGKKSVLSGGDTLDDGGEFQVLNCNYGYGLAASKGQFDLPVLLYPKSKVAEDDDANTVKRSNNLNHFLRGRRSGGGNLNHFLRGRRADLDHLFRGRRGQGDMNHLFRGRR